MRNCEKAQRRAAELEQEREQLQSELEAERKQVQRECDSLRGECAEVLEVVRAAEEGARSAGASERSQRQGEQLWALEHLGRGALGRAERESRQQLDDARQQLSAAAEEQTARLAEAARRADRAERQLRETHADAAAAAADYAEAQQQRMAADREVTDMRRWLSAAPAAPSLIRQRDQELALVAVKEAAQRGAAQEAALEQLLLAARGQLAFLRSMVREREEDAVQLRASAARLGADSEQSRAECEELRLGLAAERRLQEAAGELEALRLRQSADSKHARCRAAELQLCRDRAQLAAEEEVEGAARARAGTDALGHRALRDQLRS